jgi:hypothetical protein
MRTSEWVDRGKFSFADRGMGRVKGQGELVHAPEGVYAGRDALLHRKIGFGFLMRSASCTTGFIVQRIGRFAQGQRAPSPSAARLSQAPHVTRRR